MNIKEKLAAFEGINTGILTGNKKNKEMVKLFLQGMTYKEIAAHIKSVVWGSELLAGRPCNG